MRSTDAVERSCCGNLGRFRLFREQRSEVLDRSGFYQGTAGIDHARLRLADPTRLPCVLAWEQCVRVDAHDDATPRCSPCCREWPSASLSTIE